MIVEYHLNNANSYCNRQRTNLGNELRTEVFATIERSRPRPLQFPVVEQDIRRALTHRFPYSVLFRILNENTVRVLALRHHRPHPSFGLTRR